jgi:hypothetical protein
MIEFIAPSYNWLQQFTNHYLQHCHFLQTWHSTGTILTSNWTLLYYVVFPCTHLYYFNSHSDLILFSTSYIVLKRTYRKQRQHHLFCCCETSALTRKLWALYGNGCCIESHFLATTLYATVLSCYHQRRSVICWEHHMNLLTVPHGNMRRLYVYPFGRILSFTGILLVTFACPIILHKIQLQTLISLSLLLGVWPCLLCGAACSLHLRIQSDLGPHKGLFLEVFPSPLLLLTQTTHQPLPFVVLSDWNLYSPLHRIFYWIFTLCWICNKLRISPLTQHNT